ncbi:SH3 and multiple ankyrin repeat domains protein 2-like [Triplophysa rosa]|uniref:SH3 and multiple ankyrin repeat domains protein 2-like n=1 Tax=Triplophysa rosa TaxID=992332 RepID=UPI002546076A|nr:SH3 and multiple ankyrin repeat domains protein 2-like [Triplophysa rosa]
MMQSVSRQYCEIQQALQEKDQLHRMDGIQLSEFLLPFKTASEEMEGDKCFKRRRETLRMTRPEDLSGNLTVRLHLQQVSRRGSQRPRFELTSPRESKEKEMSLVSGRMKVKKLLRDEVQHYIEGQFFSDREDILSFAFPVLAKVSKMVLSDKSIDEFTPTAAFPALQYLESVDDGGVEWQSGLRTGDFLIEVNHQNVVKLGHRLVVNMIRQGGNRLVIKVMRVSRNIDSDDKVRKKAPPPPKRAPTTALSKRSKSMTSEPEEFDNVNEMMQSRKFVHENTSVDNIATIKPHLKPQPLISERQGVAGVPPTVPGRSHRRYLRGPKDTMRRQKSIGFTDEEKKFLIPTLPKFTRSLSIPDTSEDIPPPPGICPPSPPYIISASVARGYEPNQSIYTQALTERELTINKGLVGYHQQNSEQYDSQSPSGTLQNMCAHNRAHVPENPYSDLGIKPLYVPAKPARRKGTLVKQLNVEVNPEKTCSIPIPTIIVKEPSTSSSGKSSQGSSIEIDTITSDKHRPEDSLLVSIPFAAAIAGAVCAREKRLEVRRNSPAFLLMDLENEVSPTPRLRNSVSIDEGMFDNNMTDLNISELTIDPLNILTADYPTIGSPVNGGIQHFMTEKTLDTRSPLALGLAASDQDMKEKAPPPKGDPPKADLDQPLFIDTKLQSNFLATGATGQQKDCGGLLRSIMESSRETEKAKERNQLEQVNNTHNMWQQKSAGLLMVHTVDKAKPHLNSQSHQLKQEFVVMDSIPNEQVDTDVKRTVPNSQPSPKAYTSNDVTFTEEPVKFSFRIPLPPLPSVEIYAEFNFAEPLPPPLEFANSIDIPEDHVAETLKQTNKSTARGPLLTDHSHPSINAESKCLSVLLNCMSPYDYPPPPPEIFEPVTDLGIEEVDSRNSGDPHFEVTSTISTVSSISTLSSEGMEALDMSKVYANGQTLLMDRPPVPPKPKIKPKINKSHALYRDLLIKESVESFGQPPPAPPPPLGCGTLSQPRKTSAQGGSNHESPFLSHPDSKASVISELSSKLQQMNKDKRPKQGGSLDSPVGSRIIGSREGTVETMTSTAAKNLSPQTLSLPKSCMPGTATSPTLTDVFSMPTPPIVNAEQCCSSVSSPSASSLTLFQTASDQLFSSKPVLCWSKHDVAEWLESLNLEEHRKAFLDNEIEGTHLPNLQKEDLIDLGMTRVGHRLNIERALKLLMDI